MENETNVVASDNIETDKKKYSPSGAAIAEMICSAILMFALFLPWMRTEVGGENKMVPLMDHGPLVFVYCAVFLANIVLKFFRRSRWLSVIVAIMAVMIHTELGADAFNEETPYSPVWYYPAIGEQILFIVGLTLLAIISVSWIASLLKSIAKKYWNKQPMKLYFSCLGIFLIFLVVANLIGIVVAGNADAFFEDEDSPFKMVVGGMSFIGIMVFFFWAIIGSIIWLFRSIFRRMKGRTTNIAPEETISA